MAGIVPIAITVAGFYLFFYLSGTKGLILIGILFAIFMGLVYFKQNMLLYMPGNLYILKSYPRLT
jgi:hypothetical protein